MRILIAIFAVACVPVCAEPTGAPELNSILVKAQRAQASGDYSAAVKAYRAAVTIRPDVAQLWSNLGLMEYELRNYAEAEQALRHTLKIDRSLFVPNLFLGLDLLELDRPREAVPYLLTAERVNPQDVQALVALGRTFHVLLDPSRSRAWYQRRSTCRLTMPAHGLGWA